MFPQASPVSYVWESLKSLFVVVAEDKKIDERRKKQEHMKVIRQKFVKFQHMDY